MKAQGVTDGMAVDQTRNGGQANFEDLLRDAQAQTQESDSTADPRAQITALQAQIAQIQQQTQALQTETTRLQSGGGAEGGGETPMPVEPDGGIGDGAGPIPDGDGTDGVVGPPLAAASLPDGLQPAGDTGLADNRGNSVSVQFGENGEITGITTTRTQVENDGSDGQPATFSGARFVFDGAGAPISATSSISQGEPPVGPEPSGEVIQFSADQPQQPVLDANGDLIGFSDAGFVDNNGRAVVATLDENGDINGFEIREFTQIDGFGPFGEQGFTDVNIRIYNLEGDLLAQALS